MAATGIVIVGGGSAGWLTAAYLSARLDRAIGRELTITLVEASDIPTIGVGEATTPSLRTTIADLGIDEHDFMRGCSATFKHGILFNNWTRSPSNDPEDAYFHPFERPLRAGSESLLPYWLRGLDPHRRRFQDAVSIQHAVARLGLAPKRFEDKAYSGPMPYAYHLDAGRLAALLKDVAVERGVRHVVGKVAAVNADERGGIAALRLEDGRTLDGQFFIDCSGFPGLLIERHFGEPFIDRSDVLFCDAAVTCQVPHRLGTPIKPYTQATALEAGWVWDIGLAERRGVGYVYSRRHTDAERAEQVLRQYLGPDAADLPLRHLPFRVGYRRRQWVGNCVAVGLSGGFIEPLESTGIHLIEQAAWAITALLPRYLRGDRPQDNYNRIMARQYEMTVDFVKFHYLLSQRTDSAFWTDNVSESSWTDWLRERMVTWRTSPPDVYDMEHIHSIFDHASYLYVSLGMDHRPKGQDGIGGGKDRFAQGLFERVALGLGRAKGALPAHNEILSRIHGAPNGPRKPLDPAAYSVVGASVLNIPNNYSVR